MYQGDVVLTPVPQADGVIKNRPAIFLREMPRYRDVLVCGVSTQLQQEVKGFDEIIHWSDSDFAGTGLRSVINPARIPGGLTTKRSYQINRQDLIRKTQTSAQKS